MAVSRGSDANVSCVFLSGAHPPLDLNVPSISKSLKEAQKSCLPYQGQGLWGMRGGGGHCKQTNEQSVVSVGGLNLGGGD